MAQSAGRAVISVSVLVAGVLVAVAPAAEVVFSTRNDTAGMTTALTLMAPGVVGLALIFHVSRTLYALDRQRSAVAATALGWLVVTLAVIAGVSIAAPEGGAQETTLAMLGLAHAIGMTVAAVALLYALARALPGSVGRATARTVVVAVAGAVIGAGLGRWATAVVLDLAGTSLLAA